MNFILESRHLEAGIKIVSVRSPLGVEAQGNVNAEEK